MYNALRTGPLIPYILEGEGDFGSIKEFISELPQTWQVVLGILAELIFYGAPLLIIVIAAVSKSKKGAVISLIILSLLYGTDFLVLAIATLIVFYIAMIIIDKEH